MEIQRGRFPLIAFAGFVVLAAVGSIIKVPAVIQSVALDTVPAYLGALLFGPLFGATLGAIGHLISAAIIGFPLDWRHLFVAAGQFVIVYAFGAFVLQVNKGWAALLAAVVAVLINGIVLAYVTSFLFPAGDPRISIVRGFIPVLLIATAINVFIAIIIHRAILLFSK